MLGNISTKDIQFKGTSLINAGSPYEGEKMKVDMQTAIVYTGNKLQAVTAMTLNLVNYPRFIGNPKGLYDYVSLRSIASVKSGYLSMLFLYLLVDKGVNGEYNQQNVNVTGVIFSPYNVIEAPTYAPTNSPSDEHWSGLNYSELVGVVIVSIIVGLLILAALVFYLCFRNKDYGGEDKRYTLKADDAGKDDKSGADSAEGLAIADKNDDLEASSLDLVSINLILTEEENQNRDI